MLKITDGLDGVYKFSSTLLILILYCIASFFCGYLFVLFYVFASEK